MVIVRRVVLTILVTIVTTTLIGVLGGGSIPPYLALVLMLIFGVTTVWLDISLTRRARRDPTLQ
jgi:hypothetical protein